MRRMLDPKTIALIGATESEGTVGRTIMENLMGSGDRTHLPGQPAARAPSSASPASRASPRCRGTSTSRSSRRPRRPCPTCCASARRRACTAPSSSRPASARPARRASRSRRSIRKILRDYPMRVVGPNCLGIIRPTVGLNASFLTVEPEPGQHRADLAERRARHRHARLGVERARRLLDVRLGGQHGRRRLRRPRRLPRRGPEHTRSILIYMESDRERAALHERGAQLRAQQADHRAQAGPLLRERARRAVAHRRDGRRRRGLRGRVPARRRRARARGRRPVPRGRGARLAPAAGRAATSRSSPTPAAWA